MTMQQGFNEALNHQPVSDVEQSAIAREQLVRWLARCKARTVFSKHIQSDENPQDEAIQDEAIQKTIH